VVALAAGLAYANSFNGSFIFDDRVIIVDNLDIRQLWPPWRVLLAHANIDRPLVALSLAINFAISGFDVWSYHLFNLLVHVAAGVALFGVVRRTLLTPGLAARFTDKAFALALVVTLIWTVHPLQTQAVTYIIQRGESMMGMFYLTTMYCAARSFEPQAKLRWTWLAILACAAGMLSKQIMVTAPLMVLMFDYVFAAGSFKRAVATRRVLYAGLACTWLVLAATFAAAPINKTAGFGIKAISPLRYFVSEFPVIVHYLQLSVWPSPLVLDYAWPQAASLIRVAPYGIVLALLAGATLWLLVRRKPSGFLGVWFFVILSVSSSLMPFADLAFEHRMYLPLAAVIVLVIIGGYWSVIQLANRLNTPSAEAARLVMLVLVVTVIGLLMFLTLRRNQDYDNPVVMWADVVAKRPQNPRAHNNLGMMLAERGFVEEASHHFSEACRLEPENVEAQNNLGLALLMSGRVDESEEHLREALRLKPDSADAHYNLGRALASRDQTDEAIGHFKKTLEIDGRYAEAAYHLGLALESRRNFTDALRAYEFVVRARPDWAVALAHIGAFLATLEDPALRNIDQALPLAEKAVALTGGNNPSTLVALATVYAEAGRFPEAVETAEKAASLASDNPDLLSAIRSRIAQFKQHRTASQRNPTKD
jgi:tetratricopeptide (TPR) repeat protein